MAAYRITTQESDALTGLPWLARLVYVCVLRRWMDYASGVAGRRPKELSLAAIAEMLEVEAMHTANNRPVRPTRKQVRTALAQLEGAGLAQRLAGRRVSRHLETLVFKLPLALADSSVCNSEGTVRAQSEGTGKGTTGDDCKSLFEVENTRIDEVSRGTGKGPSTPPSEGIHPVSGNTGVLETTVVDSAREAVPQTRQQWFRFFAQCGVGFRPERVHHPSVAKMVTQWLARGVSVAQARMAMEHAHAQLGGLPQSPSYYGWAVDRVLQQEERHGNTQTGAGGGGRGVGRVSAAERQRRHAIEYCRRKGELSDAEWRTFKREIGEPERPDPLGAGDDDAVASHG